MKITQPSLSDPLPVRLREADETQLREMAKGLGVDLSKLIRLTVKAGLPKVREQFDLTSG